MATGDTSQPGYSLEDVEALGEQSRPENWGPQDFLWESLWTQVAADVDRVLACTHRLALGLG